MKPLCLVFDLDDTLYLERDYVRSGFQAVGAWAASEIGITEFAERAWNLFEQGERRRVFDAVLEGIGYEASPELVSQMVTVYRSHCPNIKLLPDAVECLKALSGRFAMALISDGYLGVQKKKVEALGIDSLFDPVVLTDSWGREYWKPHERAFRSVEHCWRKPNAEFVYIADNPAKDFTAPIALGWTAIRIRRAGSLHYDAVDATGANPGIEISDLSQLPAALWGKDCDAVALATTAQI